MGAAASKRWRQSHPEAVREQKRRYYARHSARLRLVRLPGNKARAAALRASVVAALGGVCKHCGFNDDSVLQIDHVNGNGRKDRARFANREQFLKAVLADPSGYQLLCANCNWIKRVDGREYGKGRPVGVIPRLKTTSTITED
jgi:hypothetical protein